MQEEDNNSNAKATVRNVRPDPGDTCPGLPCGSNYSQGSGSHVASHWQQSCQLLPVRRALLPPGRALATQTHWKTYHDKPMVAGGKDPLAEQIK